MCHKQFICFLGRFMTAVTPSQLYSSGLVFFLNYQYNFIKSQDLIKLLIIKIFLFFCMSFFFVQIRRDFSTRDLEGFVLMLE